MKAQARKILALIMAMVMSLSLAAPAFAAEEAVEDTSAEASVVETVETEEAKEEKSEKKAEKLEKQDANTVYVKTIESTDSKTIKVYGGKKSGGDVDVIETIKFADITGSTYTGTYVDVTKGDTVVGLVGKPSETTYRVVAKDIRVDDQYTMKKKEDFTIMSDEVTKLTDVPAASWTALTDTNNWFEVGSKTYEVSGSYFVEKQAAVDTYKVYFKLAKFEKDAFQTITDKKVVWAAAQGTVSSTKISNPEMKKLLANAKVVNVKDEDQKITLSDSTSGAVKEITATTPDAEKKYTFTTLPSSLTGVKAVTSAGVVEFPEGVTSGSFKADVTYPKTNAGSTTPTTTKETDAAAVKAALAKANVGMKFTVSGPDANGYFSVSVTKDAAATSTDVVAYPGTGEKGNNTATYNGNLVLIDSTKPGSYVEAGNVTKSIPAGFKMADQVAVAKSVIDANDYLEIPGETAVDGYYYFDTVEEMKAALNYTWCKEDLTVNYVQLNITAEESNKGITYDADKNTVARVANWASTAGADTTAKTLTKAAYHHTKYNVKDVVAPTCKKAGTETTKVMCKVCGEVMSTESKETAKIQDALTLGEKEKHYKLDKTDGVKHYISEFKTETVSESKTAKGKTVTTYICNLGEVHDELTETAEINKTTLQGSGKWDYISWGTQNAADVRDYSRLFGWRPVVMDTDVEFPTVPVEDQKFSVVGFKMADPAYTASDVVTEKVYSLDANNKVVSNGTAYFQAVLSLKDIKNGEKDCQDGSATIEINIYKLATKNEDISDASKLAVALKNNKATLVNTHTKAVVIPAEKTHVDANNDGKCDNCGTEINQGATEPTGKADISTATVKFTDLKWTGKEAQPKVKVTLDGVELAKDIDYEVEDFQETNAGTYDLIVAGKGLFTGRVVGKVTIKKVTGKIKASAKTIQAKKKKAVKSKMTIKVTGGSVKSVKASGVKGVKVSKKGEITVPKKCKGGTLKVKITMKADSNHKAASTKTVKVTIKKAK